MAILRSLWQRLFPPGPTLEEAWEEYAPRFERYRVRAWLPVCSDEASDRLSHFGGVPLLEAGADQPSCSDCGRDMPLFLQMSSREIPTEHRPAFPTGLLQVFFCLHCQPWEAFRPGCLVRTLDLDAALEPVASPLAESLAQQSIVDWQVAEDYLDPEASVEEHGLPEDVLEVLYEGGFPRTGDKLAGAPYWVQYPELPDCPECARPTEPIFQLDSNDNLDFMWGDAGVAQVVWCPAHPRQMGLVWQCH